MTGRFSKIMEGVLARKRETAGEAVSALPAMIAASADDRAVIDAVHEAGRAVLLMHHVAGPRHESPPPAFFHAMRMAVDASGLDGDLTETLHEAIDGYDVAAAEEVAFSAPGLARLGLGADDLSLVACVGHRTASDRYRRFRDAEAKVAGHGHMSLMDRVASRIAKSNVSAFLEAAKASDPKFANPGTVAGYVVEAARLRCAEAGPGGLDGLPSPDKAGRPSPDRLLEQAERMIGYLGRADADWVLEERDRRELPDVAALDAARFGSGWSISPY